MKKRAFQSPFRRNGQVIIPMTNLPARKELNPSHRQSHLDKMLRWPCHRQMFHKINILKKNEHDRGTAPFYPKGIGHGMFTSPLYLNRNNNVMGAMKFDFSPFSLSLSR